MNEIKELLISLRNKIKDLLALRSDTDAESTIATITKALEFKGENIWILIFAIIIASVGLNMNSTAVIIGAMLISPLMGPINGIGLAVGINDSSLLRKSIFNFCLMVLVSLCVSFTYFLVSPISDARSELLARTSPTLFDVFIAFFGGMAGIIATSRKQQSVAVISGVAIATALMPPLCTAGYSLANADFSFFLGAFYLFFINSFFIALATFLTTSVLLHFPKKKYMDPHRERLVRRVVTFFSLLMIVPSIFLAIGMVKESLFHSQAIKYTNEIQRLEIFHHTHVLDIKRDYSRKGSTIEISVFGEELSHEEKDMLNEYMMHYTLPNTKLIIKQLDNGKSVTTMENFANVWNKMGTQIAQKDSIIAALQSNESNKNIMLDLPKTFLDEIKLQYPDLKQIAISNMMYMDIDKQKSDTIPTIHVTWKKEVEQSEKEKLVKWLKIRLGQNAIVEL